MRKKIYTADEEFGNVYYLIFFLLIWYYLLFQNVIRTGFQLFLVPFFLAGVLILYQIFRTIQKALYFRSFHRKCMEESIPVQGRIVNVVREYYDEYTSRRRQRSIYYFLIVEIIDPETGVVNRIKSDAYRIPVYKYLAAPQVQVYTDRSGWKHVIDGFQLKQSRTEPDIPLENSNVYLKDFNEPTVFFKIITVLFLIFSAIQVLGIFK